MTEFEIVTASKFGTSLCAAWYDIEGDFTFILSEYINVLIRIKDWIVSVENTHEIDVLDIYTIFNYNQHQ